MTRVTIEEIKKSYVKFDSLFGCGIAVWKGDNEPELNHEYEVEFDIDTFFEWGGGINKSDKNNIKIKIKGNQVIFNAKVISYEHEDNILTISLETAIIFLKVVNFPNIVGYVSLTVQAEKVSIYPINL